MFASLVPWLLLVGVVIRLVVCSVCSCVVCVMTMSRQCYIYGLCVCVHVRLLLAFVVRVSVISVV